MASNLWRSMNYKTPIKYFLNTYIREYDLSKANISALLYNNIITIDQFNEFYNMGKKEREVKIGLMIKKDRSIYKAIQNGIIEAKRRLVWANNIEDYNIVSIKNDAVFVAGDKLQNIIFPPFEFRIKNEYTIFMNLQGLEIYYNDLPNPDGTINTVIDIKGLPDDKLILHRGGLLDIICDTCYRLQRENPLDIMKYLSEVYQSYISRTLPKEFYRSFDSFSMYYINTSFSTTALDEISTDMISIIDINRNLSILRDLMSIVSDNLNMSKIIKKW